MAEAAEAAAGSAITSNISYLRGLAQNTSSTLVPSPKDLLLLLPRMVSRGATFVIHDIPHTFDNLVGNGQIMAVAGGGHNAGHMAATAAGAATSPLEEAAAAVNSSGGMGFLHSFNLQQLRTFGGVFTYITSKWALGCFTAAIVLNRTQIYASARRRLRIFWYTRLAVRIVPIIMLLLLSKTLTQTIRCQTSPDFPELRYGVPGKHTGLDYSAEGGTLHAITSKLLLWETDQQSCAAVGMIPVEDKPKEYPKGSLALLWPSYQAFCVSHWVETLLCTLEGRAPATEVGMSLFEHSLAFAEAEAMVSTQIGRSPFGGPRKDTTSSTTTQQSDENGGTKKNTTEATILVTKSFIVSRFNTSPEVLLMALISCLNHLSSQILGVFNRQAEYRLLNTGIWGMGFMASFLWGFLSFTVDRGVNSGIFRFPTVCVVGFIPHTLILLGIGLCASIYSVALCVSIISPPEGSPENMSLKERFWTAHGNMQANIPLSNLRLNWREDFYSSLIRVGFTALTAASEAVFLNEGRRINVGHWTWLEEEKMEEIARLKSSAHQPPGMEAPSDGIANGVILAAEDDNTLIPSAQWQSGYARERSTKILRGGVTSTQHHSGVGANQRGGRYKMAFVFLSRIFWLLTGWLALMTIKALEKVGFRRCPGWLDSMLGAPKSSKEPSNPATMGQPKELAFWMLSDAGELKSPGDREVDVEAETRKRQQLAQRRWGDEQEAQLDQTLYEWFINGGWWGERDSSGDYETPPTTLGGADDDATSVISTTETESLAEDWESDDETFSSGRRTPTQSNPFCHSYSTRSSRASTPFSARSQVFPPLTTRHSSATPESPTDNPLDPKTLARLLNPQDAATRHQARILSAHLSSDRVVTRSQFKYEAATQGSNILTSTKQRPSGWNKSKSRVTKGQNGRLSFDEEKELLEWMIVEYRTRKGANKAHAQPPNDFSATAGSIGSSSPTGTGSTPENPGATGTKAASWAEGGDGLGDGGPQCVVCQSAARTILAWPCRCLSLCEDCRVSLAMNNFATCVCCRQEVVGFSRLFVP